MYHIGECPMVYTKERLYLLTPEKGQSGGKVVRLLDNDDIWLCQTKNNMYLHSLGIDSVVSEPGRKR